MVYYKIQLDIRVKSYRFFNLLGSIVFDFVCLDIYETQSDIRVKSYCRLNLLDLLFLILNDSIYYGTQSDIQVKSYCRLNLLRASTFNSERLDILRDSMRHPCKKLMSLEFDHSFGIQFRASRYITGLNKTSE